MVFLAEQGVRNALADKVNSPGYCLQQTRIWCGINARYPDAATAWRNTNIRKPGDRNPPRGSVVFWTGGSSGHGHVALSLGSAKIRSTDAGGSGVIATVDLEWVEKHWGLRYAGWAWDLNETTIPHNVTVPVPKPPSPTTDTNWSAVREDLIAALTSAQARNISKKRTSLHAFIKETKAELAKLPKK